MSKTAEAKQEILQHSKKLRKAVEIIKEDTTVAKLLPQTVLDIGRKVTQSQVSKYQNAEAHINDINQYLLRRVVKWFDEYIESRYSKIWYKNEYCLKVDVDKEKKTANDENQNVIDDKILGLQGVWICYSYSNQDTQKFSDKPNKPIYFNKFKMKIYDKDVVRFKTAKTDFGGKLTVINASRIVLELKSRNRKMYLVGYIGVTDDLTTLQSIKFAYTDTGDVNVKCGLIIAKRANDKSYEEITDLKTHPVTEIIDLESYEINSLNNTQIFAS